MTFVILRVFVAPARKSHMLHTFAIYVDNKPGVLNRVASLFRRRAFNIESLTVGHTETPGVSRMTVVVDTDEYGARRLEAHLYKLVPCRRVDNITAAGIPLPHKLVPETIRKIRAKPRADLPDDALEFPLPNGANTAYVRGDSLVLLKRGVTLPATTAKRPQP